jgi:acyl dehydratase
LAHAFVLAENGDCLLGGEVLHPAADPLSAARQEMAGALGDARPEDLVILAGGGLGWHLEAVLERPAPPRVLVYEPDPGRLEAAMARASDRPEVRRLLEEAAVDEGRLAEILGRLFVYGRAAGRVRVFSPRAYRRVEPELAARVEALLAQTQARAVVNRRTRALKTGLWLTHLAESASLWLRLPDLTQLAGVLAGTPAVVVGAGPSLDAGLPDLPGAWDRALVLAAASALKPLAVAGLRPHLALALEARDESRQFEGLDHGRTLLAAATAGHPHHFSKWSGPLALFHLQPWAARLAGLGRALPSGGHVTSAAFSLAVLLGCDPIVLVGQDLAYTYGRAHAQGRPGGEEEERPETVEVEAIGGGRILSSPVMLSYILWYEESAARLALSSRRVINATAAGALLPGFEHRPLADVLAELPRLTEDLGLLTQAVPRLPRPTASFLARRLAEAQAERKAVLKTLEESGLDAARALVATESAAAAALEDAGSEEEGRAGLAAMGAALSRMRALLHASAGA